MPHYIVMLIHQLVLFNVIITNHKKLSVYSLVTPTIIPTPDPLSVTVDDHLVLGSMAGGVLPQTIGLRHGLKNMPLFTNTGRFSTINMEMYLVFSRPKTTWCLHGGGHVFLIYNYVSYCLVLQENNSTCINENCHS